MQQREYGKEIKLSRREAAIVSALCAGLTNKRIAALLEISPSTVEAGLSRIYLGLGANGRVDVVAWCHQHPAALDQQWVARRWESRPPTPKAA